MHPRNRRKEQPAVRHHSAAEKRPKLLAWKAGHGHSQAAVLDAVGTNFLYNAFVTLKRMWSTGFENTRANFGSTIPAVLLLQLLWTRHSSFDFAYIPVLYRRDSLTFSRKRLVVLGTSYSGERVDTQGDFGTRGRLVEMPCRAAAAVCGRLTRHVARV